MNHPPENANRRTLPSVILKVRAESLTYLEEAALVELYTAVSRLEKANATGILIEAGCALGGSAIVIASVKSRSRPMFIYDVFGMIPPPSEKDGEDVQERYRIIKSGKSSGLAGNQYYGYQDDLLEKVTATFLRHDLDTAANNIHLVKGLFQDTIDIQDPVALAHIDGDWYDSVTTCLQRIAPLLITGGIMIIDDYYSWSGCHQAVNDYFSDKKEAFHFIRKARLHIIKK